MWIAAALMAAASAGPNGLQVLHSPSAEQTQQQAMVQRLGAFDILPNHSPQPSDAGSAAAKRSAAWRADHLTCASPKGRSREQYQAECGAWLAEDGDRAAPVRRRSQPAAVPEDRLWPVLRSP